jgi:hypothetical protein
LFRRSSRIDDSAETINLRPLLSRLAALFSNYHIRKGMKMFKEVVAPVDHVKAKMKDEVYGVGVNDAPYYTSLVVDGVIQYCPYYLRWKKMLATCYSARNGSGLLRTVCAEWHSLMGFRRWMERQDWERKELTHWLRVPGATFYSPATCLFVPRKVRSLFPTKARSQNGRPFGVREKEGRFIVTCSSAGKKRGYVGSFDTRDKAIEAYVAAKESEAFSLAYSQYDPLVRQAVLDYSSYFSTQQRSLKTI